MKAPNCARGLLCGLAVVASCMIAGCSSGPILTEVTGTVKLGGKALPNVLVQFHPDPEKGTLGPSSSGTTDVNGQFVLTCANQVPGAVVGWHRVVIVDLQEDRPPQGQPQKAVSRVNGIFTSAATTTLRPEVKAGGPPQELTLQP